MKIKDIIAGSKRRKHRNSRKNRIIQHDSLYDVDISKLEEGTKGREINHIEDLVYFYGSQGARRALNTLRQLESSPHEVTIKWDGRPAIIFGRNEKGQFIMTDKSGFSASTYDGRVTSKDELENMLNNRKTNNPVEKSKFVGKMKSLWDKVEQATPESFRGFVHGDLLYFETPKEENGKIVFMPNTTKYYVDPQSAIGKKIKNSEAGVVLHAYIDLEGNKGKVDTTAFNQGSLLVMPPVTITQPPQVDVPGIEKLDSDITSHANEIDDLLNPPAELKMSNFDDIIYTYVNNKTKKGQLNTLGKDFAEWVGESNLTSAKQQRLLAYVSEKANALNVLFSLVRGIMSMKNEIIKQLDNQPADIQATTDDNPGGEGYVVGKDLKLVNRSGFTAANMARNA